MTLLQQWEDYVKKVMPTEPAPGQLEQTRDAFYAGAAAIFWGMQADRTDDEIDAYCLATKNELQDYFKAFKERHKL